MSALLPLAVGGPVLAAVLVLLVGRRWLGRLLGLGVPATVLAGAVVLIGETRDGSVLVVQVAGWPAGISIAFAADLLSALMLAVSALLVLASTVFALAADEDRDPFFVPLVLMLTAGVYGAYLTADLFNLFVMIEIALLPSYVLIARTGTLRARRAGTLYLAVNLAASTIFLLGVGLVYATAGTVNLGELAGLAAVSVPVAVGTGVVLVALAVKAALVPVHGWLPQTYPAASPAVTALFSGLLTKIGVYALIRVVTVVYDGGAGIATVIIAVMLASMVVGVLGALGEGTTRGVLAFHMVSQVGYILVGLALAGPVGLAAVVFYLVHHTVVKTGLFLTVGSVEVRRGTGVIDRLGGVGATHPWVALAFLGGALSLTGLPPFSGFWAKLGVLRAAWGDEAYLVFAVALLVSVGTLVSMLKLGVGVFWGERKEAPAAVAVAAAAASGGSTAGSTAGPGGPAPSADDPARRPRWPAGLVLPGLALAGLSLAVGLSPEWLLELAEQAGESLHDPTAYVEGVLGR